MKISPNTEPLIFNQTVKIPPNAMYCISEDPNPPRPARLPRVPPYPYPAPVDGHKRQAESQIIKIKINGTITPSTDLLHHSEHVGDAVGDEVLHLGVSSQQFHLRVLIPQQLLGRLLLLRRGSNFKTLSLSFLHTSTSTGRSRGEAPHLHPHQPGSHID